MMMIVVMMVMAGVMMVICCDGVDCGFGGCEWGCCCGDDGYGYGLWLIWLCLNVLYCAS